MRQVYCINGFSKGSYLVYFYQYGVGNMFINAFLQAFNIGYKQIIAH